MADRRLNHFLMAIILALLTILVCSYANENNYVNMSILSTYEAHRGDIRDANIRTKHCKSLKLWIFHRHGTRLPTSYEIKYLERLTSLKDKVISNHKNGKGDLSTKEIGRIQEWALDPSVESIATYLTEEGHNETYRTARRFKEKFPNLLRRTYSKKDFLFQRSETQRTLKTAEAFIDSLFGDNARERNNIEIITNPMSNDPLLIPFAGACKKVADILHNHTAFARASIAFESTDAFQTALREVSTRLGFRNVLPSSDLVAIGLSCGYESAWYQESNTSGPWCAALTKDSVKVIEYWIDLTIATLAGYGNPATEKIGCTAVKDLWERFSSSVGDFKKPGGNENVVAYFSHDIAIMEIHTALGLLKDEYLLTENNYEVLADRKWRPSGIVPFAANVVAVLQACETRRRSTEFEILLFRNEKPWTDIKECPRGKCKWEQFKSVFKPVAQSCNLEEFC